MFFNLGQGGFHIFRTPTESKSFSVAASENTEQVEEKIVDEMALETAFEGQRFYDLMRVAIRHNDPTYLAEKIAHRGGMNAPKDEALYNRLLNTNNWYIRKE